MTAFTRLGASLWDWEPWQELAMGTRNLWLALYTSSEAKRHVPGLWQGGIPVMWDAARMKPDETMDALDDLLARDLAEYDQKTRVLRLCELPDAGEWATGGKVILSWWRRFQTVPTCGVRDAHVSTLRWLIDHGAASAGKTVSPDHERAWASTFATVKIPAPRRRGMRRLSDDNDTSTRVQPSLFPPKGLPSGVDTSCPQTSHAAVDNSASMRQTQEINHLDTLSDRVRIPDSGYRIPDLNSSSGDGPVRTTLSLVPPYQLADVLEVMAGGRWEATFSKSHQDALSARFHTWVAQRLTLDDFRFLAQTSRDFGDVWDARVLATADIRDRLDRAQRRVQERADKMALLDEFRGEMFDAIKR